MELFLEQFSLEEIAQMPLQTLVFFFRKKLRIALVIAKFIQKAVRGSYRLSKVMEDSFTID
ncbi:hypothetical protein [Bacillus thuringiensis]|uniref:hypothetical protein n=1 Tax=Bacillus thuringiensis TaxID=1428 RepID=UPI002156556F|nr:hypothetical protein [Bacillus thuringiensis]